MTQARPAPYWNNRIKRSEVWSPKRQQQRVEEGFYPTWEHLLRLHRLDYWHCRVSQQSQPGWPDYVVFGDGWLAFVELKARRRGGTKGVLTEGQKRYKASIEASGGEWRDYLLPDDWDAIDVWLNGHTGREIWGWAKSQRAGAGL